MHNTSIFEWATAVTVLAIGIVLGSAVPAAAQLQQSVQLAEQVVEGAYRVCTYRTRETSRMLQLNTPIGVPIQRTVRVGRGEPCPAIYPSWRSRPERRTAPTN